MKKVEKAWIFFRSKCSQVELNSRSHAIYYGRAESIIHEKKTVNEIYLDNPKQIQWTWTSIDVYNRLPLRHMNISWICAILLEFMVWNKSNDVIGDVFVQMNPFENN